MVNIIYIKNIYFNSNRYINNIYLLLLLFLLSLSNIISHLLPLPSSSSSTPSSISLFLPSSISLFLPSIISSSSPLSFSLSSSLFLSLYHYYYHITIIKLLLQLYLLCMYTYILSKSLYTQPRKRYR